MKAERGMKSTFTKLNIVLEINLIRKLSKNINIKLLWLFKVVKEHLSFCLIIYFTYICIFVLQNIFVNKPSIIVIIGCIN